MRTITHYVADKGSFVVNGVAFTNGYGDGEFSVYYSEQIPDGFNKYENIWFDLRECDLKIWESDCDNSRFQVFTEEKLDCEAVEIYYKNGDICLVKYF